jgi:hypothetical protein
MHPAESKGKKNPDVDRKFWTSYMFEVLHDMHNISVCRSRQKQSRAVRKAVVSWSDIGPSLHTSMRPTSWLTRDLIVSALVWCIGRIDEWKTLQHDSHMICMSAWTSVDDKPQFYWKCVLGDPCLHICFWSKKRPSGESKGFGTCTVEACSSLTIQ